MIDACGGVTAPDQGFRSMGFGGSSTAGTPFSCRIWFYLCVYIYIYIYTDIHTCVYMYI